jgi:hypothetical protein
MGTPYASSKCKSIAKNIHKDAMPRGSRMCWMCSRCGSSLHMVTVTRKGSRAHIDLSHWLTCGQYLILSVHKSGRFANAASLMPILVHSGHVKLLEAGQVPKRRVADAGRCIAACRAIGGEAGW